LRPWVNIAILASVLVLCLSLPAYASKPYTCEYTLAATSPVDDPSTGAVEASPGMDIALEATVYGTYSGPISFTLPAFDVSLDYDLKQDGISVDAKQDSYPVSSMRVAPGKTYTQTGGDTYALPQGLAPGDYTLDCAAGVSVLGIGKTERASFPIKVVAGPSSGDVALPSGTWATSTDSPHEASNGLAKLCMYPVDFIQCIA